ncbi:MAG TPA: DUF6265 family protein [Terriglobales bacterium]|nr:DUF6265 family protein [Terriglobales bacterium]
MIFRLVISVLVATSLLGFAADGGPATVGSLAWLAGPWQYHSGSSVVEELWTKPAGHTMLGVSRTLKDGRTVEFEFLRIEERDGKLVYLAQPQGRPATEFVATTVSADEVLFENPTNDFPKKIRYRRMNDDCITASVEDGSGSKKIEFPYCRERQR